MELSQLSRHKHRLPHLIRMAKSAQEKGHWDRVQSIINEYDRRYLEMVEQGHKKTADAAVFGVGKIDRETINKVTIRTLKGRVKKPWWRKLLNKVGICLDN